MTFFSIDALIEPDKKDMIQLMTISNADYQKLLKSKEPSLGQSSGFNKTIDSKKAVAMPILKVSPKVKTVTKLEDKINHAAPHPVKRIALRQNKEIIDKLLDSLMDEKKPESKKKAVPAKQEKPSPVTSSAVSKEKERDSMDDVVVTAHIAPASNEKDNIVTSGIFGTNGKVTSEDVNISIYDLVRMQLAVCWDKYHDDRNEAHNIVVTMNINFNQNGNVMGITIQPQLHLNQRDRHIHNEMSIKARKAVLECSPIKGLPLERYSEWEQIRINFRHEKQ
jgi:hypothetical protein